MKLNKSLYRRITALALAGAMFLSIPLNTAAAPDSPAQKSNIEAGDIIVGKVTLCGMDNVVLDLGFAYSDGCVLNESSMERLNEALSVYNVELDPKYFSNDAVGNQRFFIVGVDDSQQYNLDTLKAQLDELGLKKSELPEEPEITEPEPVEPVVTATDVQPVESVVSETDNNEQEDVNVPTQVSEADVNEADNTSDADVGQQNVASEADDNADDNEENTEAKDKKEDKDEKDEKEEKEGKLAHFFSNIGHFFGIGKKDDKEDEDVSGSDVSGSDVSGSDVSDSDINEHQEVPSGSSPDGTFVTYDSTKDNGITGFQAPQQPANDLPGTEQPADDTGVSQDPEQDFAPYIQDDTQNGSEPGTEPASGNAGEDISNSIKSTFYDNNGRCYPCASLDVRGTLERSLAKAFPEFSFGPLSYTVIPTELESCSGVTVADDKMSAKVNFTPEPVEITHTVFGEEVTSVMVSPLPYTYGVECARTTGTLPGVAPFVPTTAQVIPETPATTTTETQPTTTTTMSVPAYEMLTLATSETTTTTTTTTAAPIEYPTTTTTLYDMPTATTTTTTAPTTASTTADVPVITTPTTTAYDHSYDVINGADAYVNTRRKNLRLRKGPGMTYRTLRYMPKGTHLTVLDTSNEKWYYVRTDDGEEGYCWSGYLGFPS